MSSRAIQDSIDDDSLRCDDNADGHKQNSAMGSKLNGSKRVEMDPNLGLGLVLLLLL